MSYWLKSLKLGESLSFNQKGGAKQLWKKKIPDLI